MAHRVADQFSTKIEIEIHGKPSNTVEVIRYVPDASRSKNELGLSLLVPLPSAIGKTIQFIER
jgi:hypothetical protein